MPTRTLKVAQLYPGQKVVLQNDSRAWVVLQRCGTFDTTAEAIYEIECNGIRVKPLRRQLGVFVNGRPMFGPYSEVL